MSMNGSITRWFSSLQVEGGTRRRAVRFLAGWRAALLLIPTFLFPAV
jgi:hypothetical protein